MNNGKQVVIITGMDFDEEIKGLVGAMTFHYFGDMLQLVYDGFVHWAFFQLNTHISTGSVA